MHASQTTVPKGSRRDIRRAVTLGCELISNRADRPMGCLATDLSTGGMWICTAQPVRAGEHVVVCFQPVSDAATPSWGHGDLTLFAEVTRVTTTRYGTSGGGMGLEFLDLDEGAKGDLARWLAPRKMPIPRRRRPMPRRIQPAPPPPAATAFRPLGVWR